MPAYPGRQATGLVAGGNAREFIVGTPGDDTLFSGYGADIICGLDGVDYLYAGPGDDILHGGDGQDTLDGQGQPALTSDFADGGPQADTCRDIEAPVVRCP